MGLGHISIATAWSRLDHKFDLLYSKRAFVHWVSRIAITVCNIAFAHSVRLCLCSTLVRVWRRVRCPRPERTWLLWRRLVERDFEKSQHGTRC